MEHLLQLKNIIIQNGAQITGEYNESQLHDKFIDWIWMNSCYGMGFCAKDQPFLHPYSSMESFDEIN
jgi:hypothetical protein